LAIETAEGRELSFQIATAGDLIGEVAVAGRTVCFAIRRSSPRSRSLTTPDRNGGAPILDHVENGAAAMVGRQRLASTPPRRLLVLSICLATAAPVLAQTNGCVLIPDDRNPSEKLLRCGDDLTIRSAASTRYRLIDQQGQESPKGAQLDVGALMIEFKPSEGRRNFQILTPHAVAAVRGTTWAVEVNAEKTSTLVILGFVEVTRPDAKGSGVLLRAGQGADVSSGAGPIMAKRWAMPRVQALLARFGQ
jgi:hypothetical protein